MKHGKLEPKPEVKHGKPEAGKIEPEIGIGLVPEVGVGFGMGLVPEVGIGLVPEVGKGEPGVQGFPYLGWRPHGG